MEKRPRTSPTPLNRAIICSASLLVSALPTLADAYGPYTSGSSEITSPFSQSELIVSGGTLSVRANGTIQDGVSVTSGELTFDSFSSIVTSTGSFLSTVNITGSASLEVAHTIINSGTLSIYNGGSISATGTTTTIINHSGLLQVVGGDTRADFNFFQNSGSIYIGDGAVVTSQVSYINDAEASKVIIDGTGSQWITRGTTYVGKSRNGDVHTYGESTALVVKNGGLFKVGDSHPGALLVFGTNGDRATIYIGDLPGELPAAPGAISALVISGQGEAGGTIYFNHSSSSYTFDTWMTGNIQVVNNAGYTTLTGSHSYTGGTEVHGGTLDISGRIEGDVRVNGGSLIISGEVTDGTASVLGGELVVLGTMGGSINNALSGKVHGTGVVKGDLINGASVSPGYPTGTLTIEGNYSQDEDGSLLITLDGTNHGKLVVGGSATLRGLLQVGGRTSLSSVEILTAEEGVFGKFDTVDTGLISLTVRYLENSVILDIDSSTISEFARLRGVKPNERAVAKVLDRAANRGRQTALIDLLYLLPADTLESALTLLSPEQISQIFTMGFANAQTQYNNLERRLSDVRDGAIGFSSSGLALSNSRGTLNYNGMPIANERGGLTIAGWDGKSVIGKQAVAPIVETSRWSFFATGNGEWADVESTSNARGSEFSTGGVTVGADYRVSDNVVVGIAGGYANTSSDLWNSGSIELNSGRASLYGSVFGNGFYLNTMVGGAYNHYKTKRGTLGGNANGDTDGGEFNSLLGGGYDFRIGGFSVGPVTSLQYTYVGLNGYQETGSLAPLKYSSQSQDSLKSSLGLRASYAWAVGGIVIKPEVRAQWQHEFLDSTASVESAFVGGAGVFTVNGPNIGRDSLLLDAGLAVQINPALSVFAYYTGEIGRTNYSSNAINGGFRISF